MEVMNWFRLTDLSRDGLGLGDLIIDPRACGGRDRRGTGSR
jgi:hypothetical protein